MLLGSFERCTRLQEGHLDNLAGEFIDCHAAPYAKGSRLRKPKGGYRVDTRENILKPGDSEVAGVVLGNAAKSELYKRMILEEDHDAIIPSKGDPLSPAQQKVIKDWIDAGAAWVSGVVLQCKG